MDRHDINRIETVRLYGPDGELIGEVSEFVIIVPAEGGLACASKLPPEGMRLMEYTAILLRMALEFVTYLTGGRPRVVSQELRTRPPGSGSGNGGKG